MREYRAGLGRAWAVGAGVVLGGTLLAGLLGGHPAPQPVPAAGALRPGDEDSGPASARAVAAPFDPHDEPSPLSPAQLGRPAGPDDPALEAPAAARETLVRERTMMATQCRISLVVPAGEADQAERAFAAAFAAMERVNDLMSDYREDSEVSRIRALPGGASLALDPWTADNLEVSLLVHEHTEGAFDPTLRPVLKLYRFTGREESLPAPEELERARARVGLKAHRYEAATRTLTLGPLGADLDFGGVAKGYANDRAAAALAELGIRDALLTAGGEVRALGHRADGLPWRIGLRHPRRSGAHAAEIDARPGEVLSTSGDYEKYFLHEGVRHPHVLDARTGKPVLGAPASATVIYLPPEGSDPVRARAGAVADALATGLLVVGPDGAREVLRGFSGVEVIFLLADGTDAQVRAVATPGARARAQFAPGIECAGLPLR